MIFNEIKCHVNTFLGLVGMHPLHPPLCSRLDVCITEKFSCWVKLRRI